MSIHILLQPNSVTLVVHLCLHVASAFLLLCSTSCLGSQYENCQSNNTCGDFHFSYPFGKNNSGCGDPRFQLECAPGDQGANPLLNIYGDEYHILEPSILDNTSNNAITIVHANKWKSSCNLFANYDNLWSGSYFHIRPNTSFNLSFWGDCNESLMNNYIVSTLYQGRFCGDVWYYSLSPEAISTRVCQWHLQIPTSLNLSINGDSLPGQEQSIKDIGFQVTWDVGQNRSQRCGACLESKGTCGYNILEPTRFLCYCPDGSSHLDKCLDSGRDQNKTAIVIGCSFGGVGLAAIAILLLTFYAKRKMHPGGSNSMVEKFLQDYAHEMPTRYSPSQLKKMTNNFAEKLGEGGYGVVYKGKLRNGVPVAVKLLDRHRHSEIQFMNEVATIGRVHHFNLVRLVGYCFKNPTSALVYEYMLNGSLEKFLFARKEKGQTLSSEQLYSIALGAAHGIAYLHDDCDKRIIHFDIKPHNILLDADFTPKVSDFGLAKPYGKGDDHISMTAGRGTPGYVAPEVCDRDLGPVTDKSDVYSFGMLLLEIVGGRKNMDWKVSRSSQFYFPEWAFKLLERGELGIKLRGAGGEMESENEEKARRLVKVGLWCIQYNSSDRPCMSRVVQMLEGNGDDVTDPPLPLNSWAEPEKPPISSAVNSFSVEPGL